MIDQIPYQTTTLLWCNTLVVLMFIILIPYQTRTKLGFPKAGQVLIHHILEQHLWDSSKLSSRSVPVIPLEVWNKTKVERINYSTITEDERRLLEVVRKAEVGYFRENDFQSTKNFE